ncbi:MAG TPA: acyl-CoA dehydrogenase, partial [Aestuariivirga sp.]|nr:acyl-CoA dehydrogenase [Aestuariivirga sp.]
MDLAGQMAEAARAAESLCAKAKLRLSERLAAGGKVSSEALDRNQHAAHGLAWLATYATTLRELGAYAARLAAESRLGETESLIVAIAAGEYLNQIAGGIPMNQAEFVRGADLGLARADLAPVMAARLFDTGNTAEARARLV